VSVYYKATATTGLDFHSGTVDYAAALASGQRLRITRPPRKTYECCTADVLHASNTPTETLIGGSWPCRLFEVTGRPVAQQGHKFGFRTLLVVREVDAHLALGPQGMLLGDLVGRAKALSLEEAKGLAAAWDAAGAAAWDAARDAARAAARDAAGAAAWDAAWDAAGDAAGAAARAAAGLTVRDLIGDRFTQEQYDLLTGPWRTVIGPIHPDDADLRVTS
jgi:hypothetical protein